MIKNQRLLKSRKKVCYQSGNKGIFVCDMRVIAVRTLRNYARRKKEAEQPLILWYNEACKASWKNNNELKWQFGHASIIDGKRIVFNIHGNKYRLIVDIEFHLQIIFIVWVGTHAQYDKIDAKTIAYDKTR